MHRYQVEEKGASGWEMIPHLEFWQWLFELCVDGVRFTRATVMHLLYPDDPNYAPLPSGPSGPATAT